jgi:dihydrofolate reductase
VRVLVIDDDRDALELAVAVLTAAGATVRGATSSDDGFKMFASWRPDVLVAVGSAVQQLKRASGKGLLVGGVKLPLALAELGLIDEYEFVVQPRLVGHGPTLFAGLSKHIDLRLMSRLEFGSGAVAMRYEPRR